MVVAFGTPEKQILVEPVFAQYVQAASGKLLYGFDTLLSNPDSITQTGAAWLPGWFEAINNNANSLFLTIGPGDFLVHHAIALGLHTTTLILVKGALDARGSKLMPDKKDFGYSFPCDGPGRGGTCDISAWDAFYLAMFWMLNTIGWVTFYWHWKHLAIWSGNVAQFNENSNYLMGWLRDYLWLNSSQLINGYNPYGMNNLAVWAWMFLFGHLVWGDRLHVPDLLAGLLARADRDHRLGSRAHSPGEPGSLEGQARCSVHRAGSPGGSGSLHRGLHPHLCGLPDCLNVEPLWLTG